MPPSFGLIDAAAVALALATVQEGGSADAPTLGQMLDQVCHPAFQDLLRQVELYVCMHVRVCGGGGRGIQLLHSTYNLSFIYRI